MQIAHKMWRESESFYLLLHMYSDCVCVLFVYSYLLNSIVPLMSMKSPVKHTEDKSFTSQLRFVEDKKKNLSSQSVV